MNLDNLNKWLMLAANIGVLAGIILLVIEVNQNQQFLEEANVINRLEASNTAFEYFSIYRSQIVQNERTVDIWLRGNNGEELNQQDLFIYNIHCNNLLWANVLSSERMIAFKRESAAIEAANATAALINTSPGFKSCWETNKVDILNWGYDFFVDAVEASLNK